MTKEDLSVLVEEQEALLEEVRDALAEGDVDEAEDLLDSWLDDEDGDGDGGDDDGDLDEDGDVAEEEA